MANLSRFDPFTELNQGKPFGDDFFKGFSLRPVFQGFDGEPQIRLDVTEDEKAYAVKAEIAGVQKSDIKVSVDGNHVSISAEVKQEKDEKEGRPVIRSERYYGRVSRSFSLAHDIDPSAAQAKYNDGVLELTLPKKARSTRREVAIS